MRGMTEYALGLAMLGWDLLGNGTLLMIGSCTNGGFMELCMRIEHKEDLDLLHI